MTATKSEAATPLPDKLKVTVQGKEHELFMSFALLNRLAAFMNAGAADIAQLLVDPLAQEGVIKILFHKSHFPGMKGEEMDIDLLEISIDDGKAALSWAQGHVLDFLMGGLEKTAALATKSKAVMDRVKATVEAKSSSTPSLTGTSP